MYLLDTIVYDSKLYEISTTSDKIMAKQQVKKYLRTLYDKSYLNKIIENYDVEQGMAQEDICSKLRYARIVLYKALDEDLRVSSETTRQIYSHVKKLKYNNVNKVVNNISQITLVEVENANHGNIVSKIVSLI